MQAIESQLGVQMLEEHRYGEMADEVLISTVDKDKTIKIIEWRIEEGQAEIRAWSEICRNRQELIKESWSSQDSRGGFGASEIEVS